MVGDPCYDVAPLVLQLGSPTDEPEPQRVLDRHFDQLASALGEPRERLVAWSAARTVESALWYASMGEVALGCQEMRTVAVLADLLAT